MVLIPVYAQYYDENKNIITQEVTHQEFVELPEREIGIPVTVTTDKTVSVKYYDSDIKYAKSLAVRWAKRKNINVFFNTFIFTTQAKPEWWTIQPKESSYFNGVYNPEFISMYKKEGIGIIIRDIKLPSIINTSTKKNFTEEMIPF